MGATYENELEERGAERTPERTDEGFEDIVFEAPRLGHDIRFIFAAVGGGAVRIGREVANHHLKYVETVAINCDAQVQDLEEYDRRVYLGPHDGTAGDTRGSPSEGGQIARAAMPALERIFDGATFVTVLCSLGGGSGTGALPYVIEAAVRSARVVTVFAVKPFKVEGDRRAVADRALARLHFVEPFVEKQEFGAARLQILDNESLHTKGRTMLFKDVNLHWGRVIATHIDRSFIGPSEHELAKFHENHPVPAPTLATSLELPRPAALDPMALPPLLPQAGWAPEAPSETELTFEVDRPGGPGLS